MHSAMLAGVFATMALINHAHAATGNCPPIQDIQQTEIAGGGYRYQSLQPDGRVWAGENRLATASYLTDSIFHNARYYPSRTAVVCTYRGLINNDVSFSVTLEPINDWNTVGPIGDWRGTYCEDANIEKCSFTLR